MPRRRSSARPRPGDVVGLMCHAERQEVYDWIQRAGPRPTARTTCARRYGARVAETAAPLSRTEVRGRLTLLAVTLGSGMAHARRHRRQHRAASRSARTSDASLAQLQWVTNGYLLALASLILVGGSLGDRLGRRRVFVVGVVVVRGRLRALRARARHRAS